ncbi:MAG: hypothetical protein GY854_29075 [Deltaproteobacteria bacterium]|nr:hypothetical protein [Deltaproteobacteria bacterium]
MSFIRHVFLAIVPTLILMVGCKVSVEGSVNSDGDAGADSDADSDADADADSDTDTDTDTDDSGLAAGFSWSWTLVDYDTNAPIDCETAGAEYARIQITDSEGASHDIWWLCSDLSGETDTRQIAAGDGTVTASLLTINEVAISQTDPWTFDFKSGELDNELNSVEFGVELWNPEAAADASLTWEWMKATVEDWQDPYADAEYFSESMCTDMGIDYVFLWYWDDDSDMWRAGADVTDFTCGAIDQPTDDAIWGDEVYSGLHIDDFLLAGTYKLLLGFYAEATTTDMLLYYDSAGDTGDSLDGVLAADENTTDGTNLYTTVFEMEDETVFGVLKVEMLWGQSEGNTYDTCADSNVKEMGFLLRSDGWVAAEVELGNGLECLDWLNFEEVPVLEDAYELLVSGLSKEDDFLWYHLCTGLEPEVDVTLDTASGYECKVTNTLEGN